MKNLYKLLILSLLFFAGCFPGATYIEQGSIKPGSRVAVVAGTDKAANIKLASVMTTRLSGLTTLSVMSQARVASRLRGYPFKIQGPYGPVISDVEEDYTRTDKRRIAQIIRNLNVDAVFVVWTPLADVVRQTTRTQAGAVYTTTVERLHVIQQFFDRKATKELAHMKFEVQVLDESTRKGACVIGGGKLPATKQEAMEQYSELMVKYIGKKFKVAKKK